MSAQLEIPTFSPGFGKLEAFWELKGPVLLGYLKKKLNTLITDQGYADFKAKFTDDYTGMKFLNEIFMEDHPIYQLQDLNRQNFLKRLASLFAPQALKDLLGLQLKLRLQLLDASVEDKDKFMQGLQGIQWSEQTTLQTCLNAPNDSGKPLADLLKSLDLKPSISTRAQFLKLKGVLLHEYFGMHGPDWYYHDALDDLREKILLDNTYDALKVLEKGASLIQDDHLRTKFTNFLQPFNQIWYQIEGALKSLNLVQENLASGFVLDKIKAQENMQTGLLYSDDDFMNKVNLLQHLSGLTPVKGTADNPLQISKTIAADSVNHLSSELARLQIRAEKNELFNTVDLKAKSLIQFQTKILNEYSKLLYVRECYPALLNITEATWEKGKRMIILGNPGIGKSYFGFFVILTLISRKQTIVYDNGSMKRRLLITQDGIAWAPLNNWQVFGEYLDQKTTYYIVDAIAPPAVQAKTLLVTSPRKNIWHEFSKQNAAVHYMPIWTEEELLRCAPGFELDANLVKELFGKWGGIPRYVLLYAGDSNQQQSLETALASADMELVKRSIKQLSEPENASHKLLHIIPDENFIRKTVVFASSYVEEKVFQKLFDNYQRDLKEFLAASDSKGELGSLRGVLFERYVLRSLSAGGNFTIKRLSGTPIKNEPTTLILPKRDLMSFENLQGIAGTETGYLVPKAKNFETADFFLRPDKIFQVTISINHGLKHAGLQNILDQNFLTNPSLYLVVPEPIFQQIGKQNYLDSNGHVMKSNIRKDVKEISQFALEIKLNS